MTNHGNRHIFCATQMQNTMNTSISKLEYVIPVQTPPVLILLAA
ncbi:hypothetical protein D779_0803 [Imhoffiella purpurea]|uniref:Uncharacterized protein n=1 Tax=Imhoffiella purpurea TaxID=1249627 RepID=W9VFW1_9GAMM|nr:hypothetical protein D779_0803 [Imhoffiella purpurea]